MGAPVTRRAVLASLTLATLAPAGCLNKHIVKNDAPKAPPKGRIVSSWDNKVVFAPDASRGGAVISGLHGRAYLFGPDMGVPYIGDGKLIIDLYDATSSGPDGQPKLTDHFEIGPDALRQFARRDFVGEGYDLFFPWFKYHLGVKQVYLQMRYVSANGDSYFHQSGTFPVDHTESRERVQKNMPINNPVAKEPAPSL
jgi:hypothetical protein